jgi:hypothetical protein
LSPSLEHLMILMLRAQFASLEENLFLFGTVMKI